mmetsp:Transcript_76625/g.248014  ORF Transcript_76625/g.248014 Transcript_76625/m.248014 type:complete len:316 (-) Transcript_76625:570-1517(-)
MDGAPADLQGGKADRKVRWRDLRASGAVAQRHDLRSSGRGRVDRDLQRCAQHTSQLLPADGGLHAQALATTDPTKKVQSRLKVRCRPQHLCRLLRFSKGEISSVPLDKMGGTAACAAKALQAVRCIAWNPADALGKELAAGVACRPGAARILHLAAVFQAKAEARGNAVRPQRIYKAGVEGSAVPTAELEDEGGQQVQGLLGRGGVVREAAAAQRPAQASCEGQVPLAGPAAQAPALQEQLAQLLGPVAVVRQGREPLPRGQLRRRQHARGRRPVAQAHVVARERVLDNETSKRAKGHIGDDEVLEVKRFNRLAP